MTSRQTKAANLLISEHADLQVTAKIERMPKGYIDKWHKHPWHQIVFPFEGILQTKVAAVQFVIPHTGMLFIPANTEHESFVMTDTKFIGIYLNPKKNNNYPQQSKAVSVSHFYESCFCISITVQLIQMFQSKKFQICYLYWLIKY